jgi:hypothetical protein
MCQTFTLWAQREKLSINALPESTDTLLIIPLGLKTETDGEIVFNLTGLPEEINGTRIYLHDRLTGAKWKCMKAVNTGSASIRENIPAASSSTCVPHRPRYRAGRRRTFHSIQFPRIPQDDSKNRNYRPGNLAVLTLTGQTVFVERIYDNGYHEFNPGLKEGVLYCHIYLFKFQGIQKIYFRNR